MSAIKKEYKRITTKSLVEMKSNGEKIAMLTAYDYTMAKIVDHAGIDIILVGDSASNVMAGHETTLPITLDEMIYHASSVIRAIERCLVVVDLPFGTYQGNSYPEINGVWYKIYAGDSPDFICDESHLIDTVTNLNYIYPVSGEDKKFFKIVVSDQP